MMGFCVPCSSQNVDSAILSPWNLFDGRCSRLLKEESIVSVRPCSQLWRHQACRTLIAISRFDEGNVR